MNTREATMRAWATATIGAFALGVAFTGDAEAKTVLKVYTAIEEEQLPGYKEAFEKAHPDIEINWQRDSTGVITLACWRKRTIARRTSSGDLRRPA
jgi:iron(III) transport system substrate-binding protein